MKLRKYRLLAATSIMSLSIFNHAYAQSILDPSTWFSTGPEGDKQRQSELKQAGASREYKPRQIGLWLIESSANAGVVYDTNIYGSRFNAQSATGAIVSPTIVGRYTDGGQNTTFYINGNLKDFSSAGGIMTFDGRIGLGNSLEIQRGTVWKALVQIGRSQDDTGAYNATGQGQDATGVYVKPINSNSLFAATSLLSKLDYAQFAGFVSGGVSANLTRFEDAELSDGSKISQTSRDTNSYTITGRVGWNISPTVYTFIEPSTILQQTPNVANGDTTTYRLSAGVGTDRINLMRGEAYAGFARQSFNDLTDDAQNGGVYGLRLSWFPTRDLTFNSSYEDTLGVTAASNGGVTTVYSSRTRTVGADVSYAFDRRSTFALRSSYSTISYTDTGREDKTLRLGADINYMVSANMGVQAAYTNVNVDSSNDLNSISKGVYSIGLTARF